MRVKFLAQEHNAVPRPGLEPGPPDLESSALTIRPQRLPSLNRTDTKNVLVKKNLRAACQKGKLEYTFIFKPWDPNSNLMDPIGS